MKRKWLIRFLFVFLLILSLFSLAQVTPAQAAEKRESPTLFVHGFHGGPGTFDNMISIASVKYHANRALVAEVSANGVKLSGHWPKNLKRPMIQVIFTDNHANWNRDAKWLNQLLQTLKDRYGVSTYNAIGHSRGCEALIIANEQNAPLRLKRLVTIAGPIDGAIWRDNGNIATKVNQNGRPNVINPEYQQIISNSQNFPTNVSVLSIAGDLDDGSKSDGVVTLTSATALPYALKGRSMNYHQYISHGRNAQHSRLPRFNHDVQLKSLDFIFEYQ